MREKKQDPFHRTKSKDNLKSGQPEEKKYVLRF